MPKMQGYLRQIYDRTLEIYDMKLPKPRKRGDAYQIEIMINGKRKSATRDTAKECEQWAAQKILEAKANVADEAAGIKPHYPFKTLFYKYYEEVGKGMRGSTYVKEQLGPFDEKFGQLAEMSIYDITAQHLTNWRNKRLRQVGANTVLREIALYSSVFSYAVKELFLLEANQWAGIKKPAKPKARSRRILDGEVEILLSALNYKRGSVPTLPEHYVAWAFLFALETAMRRGEILGINMSDIYDRYVHLELTKNGESRDVPLNDRAKDLLSLIKHDGSKLIPQSDNAFRLMWERRKSKAGLSDIHFHDTRHEAISRFVANNPNLKIEVLAKITGHKDLKTLYNTYYNPNAEELADMING